MHALILAGGEGSRLRSDGVLTPKAFLELDGRPLLVRLTESLHGLGCESVTALVRASVLDRAGALLLQGDPSAPRIVACETASSLHTLARGLEVMPPGPVLCVMVDSVLREHDWRELFARAERLLRGGADACVAVTPFVDDERPLYVARHAAGAVAAFQEHPSAPALVTGGVYFLSTRVRTLVAPVLALGIERMRGLLRWLVEHGYRIETAEVARIVDLDRSRDLAVATAWLSGSPAA
ncbi:MAG TPA: NTP transferase domain-containing protein [Gemmatimonadales bacterium]|nr:NTP transferase domain-containing protein [Gemmatimonadales bacterium]